MPREGCGLQSHIRDAGSALKHILPVISRCTGYGLNCHDRRWNLHAGVDSREAFMNIPVGVKILSSALSGESLAPGLPSVTRRSSRNLKVSIAINATAHTRPPGGDAHLVIHDRVHTSTPAAHGQPGRGPKCGTACEARPIPGRFRGARARARVHHRSGAGSGRAWPSSGRRWRRRRPRRAGDGDCVGS
jgi:hypothetical protein